jgi:hypothetical protein
LKEAFRCPVSGYVMKITDIISSYLSLLVGMGK